MSDRENKGTGEPARSVTIGSQKHSEKQHIQKDFEQLGLNSSGSVLNHVNTSSKTFVEKKISMEEVAIEDQDQPILNDLF